MCFSDLYSAGHGHSYTAPTVLAVSIKTVNILILGFLKLGKPLFNFISDKVMFDLVHQTIRWLNTFTVTGPNKIHEVSRKPVTNK